MIKKIIGKTQQILARNREARQLKKLLKTNRYTSGEFNFNKLKIKFPDAASFLFMYKEIFHHQVYKFKAKNTPPFIIDCGANIGLSVIYFKQLYPTAKVLAFEPDQEIFKFLGQNINLNVLKGDVTLINKAVWNEESSISFKNEGSDSGRICFENDTTTFTTESEVQTVKLSKYIDKEVDFLKIDIEGAEAIVIKEIENKLYLVDNIFIEYHSLVNSKQELQLILEILSRNKFRYYIESPPFRLRHNAFIDKGLVHSFDLFLNVYAIKEKEKFK